MLYVMDFVALFKQEVGQIGAILAGDACNKGFFIGFSFLLINPVLALISSSN